MTRSKTLLVCGQQGSGKTTLIRHFLEGQWVPDVPPTVGLDEHAGRVFLEPSNPALPHDLQLLLPDEGLELVILEIGGGKGGHLRGVPRGQTVDGILVCYDLCNRDSFHNVAHLLLQHRTDRHLQHHSPAVVAVDEGPAHLAAAICGTKADVAGVERPREVAGNEALDFAQRNGVRHAFTASSKTGRGVAEVFHSLIAAILEADEEAEAERLVSASAPPASQTWGLRLPGASGDAGLAMTSPRGGRPHEPDAHSPADRLVEVVDAEGRASAARPLATCLQRGLLHRAVHVWACDAKTGGLLLRRYASTVPKHPGRWGPTCHGEVLCYGSTSDVLSGPHTSEVSVNTAQRLALEQLGAELPPADFEHWFSCTSRDGTCHELLDVYVVRLQGTCPIFRMARGEEVEWVHFTDIFGVEAALSDRLFHIEESYRGSMVTRMRARILHADREG